MIRLGLVQTQLIVAMSTHLSDPRPKDLNLLVYAMACNAPGLPEETGAVSLELGVMADLGKLITSAWEAPPGDWRIAIYTDMYPHHSVQILRKPQDHVEMRRTLIERPADRADERVQWFISQYYDPAKRNALIIGGHGMTYAPPRPAEFWPVAFRQDGSIDILTLPELTQAILAGTGGKHLDFVVLDTCCLSTLDTAVRMNDVTDYVVAYQQEGPWNGFISSSLLELCQSNDLPTGLVACLQRYANNAVSEEDPSPMTLIYTPAAQELYNLIETVPRSPRPQYRDLATYILSRRNNWIDKREFIQIYERAIISYQVPSNYRAPEMEHGLAHYI
jgi:hypothetical protein